MGTRCVASGHYADHYSGHFRFRQLKLNFTNWLQFTFQLSSIEIISTSDHFNLKIATLNRHFMHFRWADEKVISAMSLPASRFWPESGLVVIGLILLMHVHGYLGNFRIRILYIALSVCERPIKYTMTPTTPLLWFVPSLVTIGRLWRFWSTSGLEKIKFNCATLLFALPASSLPNLVKFLFQSLTLN